MFTFFLCLSQCSRLYTIFRECTKLLVFFIEQFTYLLYSKIQHKLQNTSLNSNMILTATVLSNLKFYMNKKHIEHRGVNNDVQTKHKNMSLLACKSLFRSMAHNNNENIDVLKSISCYTHFCSEFMPNNKLALHRPLIFGAYNYKSCKLKRYFH